MIGMCSPHMYCYSKGKKPQTLQENQAGETPSQAPHLVPLTIGCFIATQEDTGASGQGMRLSWKEEPDQSDPSAGSQRAFLDLSYYLSIGNGEDAFRAIKQVRLLGSMGRRILSPFSFD